jgi:MFS family permease
VPSNETKTVHVKSDGAVSYTQLELAIPERPRECPRKVPIRELLVFPVVISVINYANLAFLDLSIGSLHPLFYAMPLEYGGFGLSPPAIGQLLSAFGFTNGLLQALFFAKIVDRWGAKRVFFFGMVCALPVFGLFPVMSYLARNWGLTPLVWMVLAFQLTLFVIFDMAFGELPVLRIRGR